MQVVKVASAVLFLYTRVGSLQNSLCPLLIGRQLKMAHYTNLVFFLMLYLPCLQYKFCE